VNGQAGKAASAASPNLPEPSAAGTKLPAPLRSHVQGFSDNGPQAPRPETSTIANHANSYGRRTFPTDAEPSSATPGLVPSSAKHPPPIRDLCGWSSEKEPQRPQKAQNDEVVYPLPRGAKTPKICALCVLCGLSLHPTVQVANSQRSGHPLLRTDQECLPSSPRSSRCLASPSPEGEGHPRGARRPARHTRPVPRAAEPQVRCPDVLRHARRVLVVSACQARSAGNSPTRLIPDPVREGPLPDSHRLAFVMRDAPADSESAPSPQCLWEDGETAVRGVGDGGRDGAQAGRGGS
jgi:hypothetical protein